MANLSDKLERIELAVDRIRTKVELPTQAIEEVATAVENMGSGAPVKSNVYRVGSLEERDAITDMVEDDMCIVYGISEFYCDGSKYGNTLIFPETIVVDTAVTSSISVNLRYGSSSMQRITYQVSKTMMRVTDYSNYKTIANYTSTDGITYTRTTTVEEVTYDGDISLYGSTFNTNITPFMKMKDLVFDGIFTYLNGEWGYTDVGAITDPAKVFTTAKFYANKGYEYGTFDRNQHDTRNIVVSDTEPENKVPIWFKPDVMPNTTKYVIQQMNFTKEELLDFLQPETVYTSSIDASGSGFLNKSVARAGSKAVFAANNYMLVYDFVNKTLVKKSLSAASSSSDFGTYSVGSVGNYIYGLGSTNAFMYNVSTDTLSKFTSPCNSSGGYIRDIFTHNNKIYFVDYSNNSNSDGVHVTGNIYVFTAGSTSYTTKYLPVGLKVWYASVTTPDPTTTTLFVEDGYAYMLSKTYYDYPDTTLKNQWKLAKVDIETMTIADIVVVDKDVDDAAYTEFNSWVNSQYANTYRTQEMVTVPRINKLLYEDDKYAYRVSTQIECIVRVDKAVVKEAIEKKDMMILIYKRYVSCILDLNANGMFDANNTVYYNGEYYACVKDSSNRAVIKKQKIMYRDNPLSVSGHYIIMDTSDMKYAVNLYENEYIHFNDIYYFNLKDSISASEISDILISGEIYIYDSKNNKYNKVN